MIERLYDINRVLDLKERLTEHADLVFFIGKQLTGSTFRDFIKGFKRLLPGRIQEQVVRESLLHLAGVVLTRALLAENAWRLAGNLSRLEAWRPAVPWSRQVSAEYAPVQIVTARRAVQAHKHAAEFEFQVLAGTAASCVITKIWSHRLCAALSKALGFSSLRGGFPFDDVMQFVNLRMYVLLDPAKSLQAPDFEEVWQEESRKTIRPISCYNYNRRWLRMRAGKDFTCPKNFDRTSNPCHLCPVGQVECLMAVHDLSYVRKKCDACQKSAWFDPASPRKVCVDCHHKSLGKKQ